VAAAEAAGRAATKEPQESPTPEAKAKAKANAQAKAKANAETKAAKAAKTAKAAQTKGKGKGNRRRRDRTPPEQSRHSQRTPASNNPPSHSVVVVSCGSFVILGLLLGGGLVDVRPSKVVEGEQGAWSIEPIVGRTLLGEYTGQRLGPNELAGVPTTYMMEVDNGPHLDPVFIVGDGSKWPHRVNHAPHDLANCQFEQNDLGMEVWSRGSIMADTELLADYGFEVPLEWVAASG
jgi:hypothetical protein